jgi:peptidyl-prolyl cis-trans isomerase SurA
MRRSRALLAAGLVTAIAISVASPARAVVVERIVAVVGERPILLSELRGRARPFQLQIAQRVPPGAQQAAAESQMLKELMQKMVDEELVQQAAEKAHVTVTETEVDKAFENIAASQGMTVSQLYQEARARSGLDEQDYRDEIRRQILEGKMLQLRVKGRVHVSEEDVRSMYDRTVREEKKRREYHPAWIVLRIFPGSSPEAVEQRKALADQLASRARRGEDFAALAAQYSDDSATRDKGGDLGIRAPDGSQAAATGKRPVLAPELEAAVMQLEAGQVTAPIHAGDALVVLKLLTRQPSHYTTFDAAKDEMMQRIQAEILERAKRKWIEELKQRTHLDVRL